MKTRVLGLTGVAESGKDTTFKILSKYMNCQRFAFADKLKEAVRPLCLAYFGIDSVTCSGKDKTFIRDFLVAFGNTARKRNPRVWIEAIKTDIEQAIMGNDIVAVVTDVRFDEINGDEADFIQKELGGLLISVDRIMDDGSLLKPANASEAYNYPRMKARADASLVAANMEDLVLEVQNKLLSKLALV